MASKIILKKSSVAAKAPVAGDLDFGELAINYTDSKLYFKKADGSIDAFSSAAASAPVSSVAGYTGAVTATNLLDAIKTVDGAGSGLDADTLDGLSSASFYLASNPNGYTSNLGTVTSVGATSPVVSSGGATPTISMPAATASANGYMTSAYASKLDGVAAGATNVTNTNQLTNGAGYITSSASISGNAATATALQTARTINGVSFNGTANITVADSTKQPLDADLTAIAALVGTTGLLRKTAADTWSLDTNAYVTSSGVTSVSGAGGYGGLTLSGTVTTTGSLTLGGTPTGTWPISVTGNAATASNGGVTSVNGATGAVTVSGGQYYGTAATKAIMYNSNTIAENITVTAGNNGLSAGPITINSGFTVTIASGAVWVIV
jgi:hypothetical protein